MNLFGNDGFSCKGNHENPNGCTPETVATKLHEIIDTGIASPEPPKKKQPKPSEEPDWRGFTLDEYCAAKQLDRRLMEHLFGASTVNRCGKPVVAWTYHGEDGKPLAMKIRKSTSSHDTYWEPADPHVPYGLGNPLNQNLISKTYDLIIAEGETDTHTLAAWSFVVIGVSGAEGWLPEYADLPIVENAARVFIGRHEDAGGAKFVAKVLKSLPNALILKPGQACNDFNELHLKHYGWEGEFFERHPFIQSIDIAIQAATFERALRQPKSPRQKPRPMRDEAFHGLAGKVVKLLEPVLETDRASILTNFLGCAGVLFGREAYVPVVADRHYPADYFLTVGNSAISRKGTTTNAVLELMERVKPGFTKGILRGLSTGQGLITALIKKDDENDEREMPEPIAPAVLIEVSEFAELLAVMKREENTLVSVMRDAWDGKSLWVLTRAEPLRVGGVSIGTICHITRAELLSKLTSTDRANGFANRYLFTWTERAKLLPKGNPNTLNYNEVVTTLHAALEAATGRGAVDRDEYADALWCEEYKRLTTRADTMTDALLSRAEAHTVRLSLLYALLDSSPVIREEHLRAALAVWDYCEESVRFIFGEAADPDYQRILRKLEDGPLTSGEIRRLGFGDHKAPEWIAEKMTTLESLRKVRRSTKQMKSKTVEAWELVQYEP